MTVQFQDISLRYEEKQVLQHFNLTLPERGLVCFFGPSGCGKTTLLRLLAGLVQPDSGELSGLMGLRSALVFQENRLLPWLTALENVALVLPDGDLAQARYWLAQVELAAEAEQLPGALSGGMQRRVALARALAYGGDLLLLDEPFAGLDMALAERLLQRIREAYGNKLTVLITHDRELTAGADRLYTVRGLPLMIESGA